MIKLIKDNIIFILIIIVIIVVRLFIITVDEIVGPSMETTLENNDLVITDNQLYKVTGLDRFDIIVFDIPREGEEFLYVKRIIGLPGERVAIKNGILYVNDKEIEVDDDIATFNSQTNDFDSGTIPENHYFVLGDNRPVSSDSRYPQVGYVSEDIIRGHVVFRHRPLNKIGPL